MRYAAILTLTAPRVLTNEYARQAVADILEQHLAAAREAVDSAGRYATALGHWSGVHPEGALLALILEALDPETALGAATDLIAVLLQTEPVLRDWRLTSAEIEQPDLDSNVIAQQPLSQSFLISASRESAVPEYAQYQHPAMTVDQQLALRTAATRLADEFAGIYGSETIERFLHSSYDQFADASSIAQFLPLLAERFARQRLHALAKVEGLRDDGRPVVLFLCVHNAARSQMALGFFHHLAADGAVGWSGGSEPGIEINPAAVAAMAERGIDITAEYPKPWTDEVVRAADVVITMGCGDACPIFPGTRYLNWDLDDPAGQDVEHVRPIRDEIERRVRGLLDEIGVPVDAGILKI